MMSRFYSDVWMKKLVLNPRLSDVITIGRYVKLIIVLQEQTPDNNDHDKSVNQFFRQLAGEDLQIDCYELQNVLSFALKKGLQ